MTHEHFDMLAGVWALGALEGDERRVFEAHWTEGCERCRALVRETEEALAASAAADPGPPPPVYVRDALLRRAERSAAARRKAAAPPSPRRRWLPWAVGAAAVAAGAALTGGWVAALYEAKLGYTVRQAITQRQRLQEEEGALRRQVEELRTALDLLRDPVTQVVTLRGLAAAPGASGRLIWHATTGGHLFVSNLPAPPPGKTYELWTISAGKPRAAGVFAVDERGVAMHPVAPTDGPVQVFAVTLEPAGGVAVPTGPMVLASK